MPETPFQDALDRIPREQILITGGASKEKGAEVHGSIQHEQGRLTVGADAGVSQKQSWSVAGMLKWVWGGKK